MKLPWNFEAFRNFISFETLQQAASVLCLFEGKDIFNNPYLMQKFENLLSLRTGYEWLPERTVDEDIIFNTEGNLFRNKARVFTSFYLIYPSSLEEGTELKITPFAKALGTGKISKRDFYKTIIQRFEYPHPAYKDNWSAWTTANKSLKPLIYILKILYALHNKNPSEACITVPEFSAFAHSAADFKDIDSIVEEILKFRKSGEQLNRTRSDDVDRKVGDILGFLCMTGFTYYNSKAICLNLIDVHPTEKVFFYEKRNGVNTKEEILNIISDGSQK